MTLDDFAGLDCSTCAGRRVLTVDTSGEVTQRRDEPTTTVRCPGCSADATEIPEAVYTEAARAQVDARIAAGLLLVAADYMEYSVAEKAAHVGHRATVESSYYAGQAAILRQVADEWDAGVFLRMPYDSVSAELRNRADQIEMK